MIGCSRRGFAIIFRIRVGGAVVDSGGQGLAIMICISVGSTVVIRSGHSYTIIFCISVGSTVVNPPEAAKLLSFALELAVL